MQSNVSKLHWTTIKKWLVEDGTIKAPRLLVIVGAVILIAIAFD